MKIEPKFNVIDVLQPGGQKQVFLIECEGQKMILKKGKCNTDNGLERIIREVRILRELDSIYFPKNYYFSYNIQDGTFEIIEEYIEGMTLRQCMKKYKSETEISSLIIDIIMGMQLLWRKEIVHRDLKPENIIISEKNNKPVIIDLGIARSLLEESLTKTIMPIGPCTVPYASPEQLLNQKNIISPKSDFFSLGIIAMELYNGYNPFDPRFVGSGLGFKDNILNGNKKIELKKNEKSEKFVNIFLKCLETQSYNRYRKYTMLKEKIEELLKEENI